MKLQPIVPTNVLTKSYLVQLATNFQAQSPLKTSSSPRLDNLWYLVAAAAFSTCNRPQEIPKLYHFALRKETVSHGTPCSDEAIAKEIISLFEEDQQVRMKKINEWYQDPNSIQRGITERFREVILKSGPLTGLPKAINSLRELAKETPSTLSVVAKTGFDIEDDYSTLFQSVGRDTTLSNERLLQNGSKLWRQIYGKVSNKVTRNLGESYPDLLHYTIMHVYGSIMSYSRILTPQETSMIIIASLVPQDVNAQLWGHLKGAVNLGCDHEIIEEVRLLSIAIGIYCGVRWRSDVVAKL